MIQPHLLLLFITPLVTLFLFAYVYGYRSSSRLNRAFLFLAGILFLLTLSEFARHIIPQGRLYHALVNFSSCMFLLCHIAFVTFVYAFVKRPPDLFYWIAAAAGTVLAILPFSGLPMQTAFSISDSGYTMPVPNKLFIAIYFIYAIPVSLTAFGISLHAHLTTHHLHLRRQLLVWHCGIGIATLYVCAVNFILPVFFAMQKISQFGSFAVLIVDVFTYWLVRRYNFLTVNINQIEEILAKVLADASDMYLILDSHGRVVRANRHALDVLGIDPDYRNAKNVSELFPRMVLDKKRHDFITVLTVRHETIRVAVAVTPLSAADETAAWLVFIHDITHAQMIEDTLRRNQQLETLGVLAGGIAHNFNNFLAGILSALGVLRMSVAANDDGAAEVLDEAESAVARAHTLTRQLLSFSAGGLMEKKPVDLEGIVRECLAAAVRGSSVQYTISNRATGIYVDADSGQMALVFSHLAGNAIQAMAGKGSITVTIEPVTVTDTAAIPLAKGSYIEIRFSDNGPGVPVALRQRIFDPYFTTKKDAAGLGLTTVFSILKKHGGSITVSEASPTGALFVIWLPQTPGTDSPPVEDFETTVAGSVSGKRILIMEDEKVIALMLTKLLEKSGNTVLVANDGLAAFDLYAAEHAAGRTIDLIITDLLIPRGVGGLEFSRMVFDINPAQKIIVSSGYSVNPVIGKFRDHGFVAVLKKPYTLESLNEVLTGALNG